MWGILIENCFDLPCVLCPQANQEGHQNHDHPDAKIFKFYYSIVGADIKSGSTRLYIYLFENYTNKVTAICLDRRILKDLGV